MGASLRPTDSRTIQQENKMQMTKSLWIAKIIKQVERHASTWPNETQEYWLNCLISEIGELADALRDDHPDPPERELVEISSLCINWLNHFYTRKQ